jgi:Ca2+-binding RTX toxin-like protein
MKLVRVGVLVGLIAAQGLVFAGAAHAEATSVQAVRGQLLIRSSDLTDNEITVVMRDGKVYVFDVAALNSGLGCEQVNPTAVACRSGEIRSVSAWLGDGNDRGAFHISLPVKVDGGNGNDTLTGGQGGDTLSGNAGNDTLKGGLGDDVIHGGDGLDHLFGEENSDTLDDYTDGVGIEVNFFDGGTGNDIIKGTGKEMRDMVVYERSTDIHVNLAPVAYLGIPPGVGGQADVNGNLVEHDQITDVHDIRTGSGDDVLIGSTFDAKLESGTGTDTCGYYINGIVIKVCP